MAEPTINIPQLIAVGLISFFIIRWLFFSPSSNASSGNARASGARQAAARRVDPRQVEQVAQMFPQISRRDIHWDLQRNGGSVTATIERALGGRLEVAPPSYQPLNLTPTPAAVVATAPRTATPSKSAHPDLITKYNLGSRVYAPEPATSSSASASPAPKQGWSQNKNERQALMQRRREEMILAARRKMEEKDKQRAS